MFSRTDGAKSNACVAAPETFSSILGSGDRGIQSFHGEIELKLNFKLKQDVYVPLCTRGIRRHFPVLSY